MTAPAKIRLIETRRFAPDEIVTTAAAKPESAERFDARIRAALRQRDALAAKLAVADADLRLKARRFADREGLVVPPSNDQLRHLVGFKRKDQR